MDNLSGRTLFIAAIDQIFAKRLAFSTPGVKIHFSLSTNRDGG